ncbi:hypothetical protein RJT34_22452 [Clitoria ternatea]|uniref:Uncharacterized protein n=1 Tax=Clitoria ternatea TaxID=43366 RepID=A0AAN9FJB6_CLITE
MTNREKRGTNRTYGWEAGAVWERQFFKKLLAKQPKSVLKSRKSEFDGYLDDEKVDENSVGAKKGRGRGRGKGRGRTFQFSEWIDKD